MCVALSAPMPTATSLTRLSATAKALAPTKPRRTSAPRRARLFREVVLCVMSSSSLALQSSGEPFSAHERTMRRSMGRARLGYEARSRLVGVQAVAEQDFPPRLVLVGEREPLAGQLGPVDEAHEAVGRQDSEV